MEVAGILDNKNKLRKSFLYLILISLLASTLSLVHYNDSVPCDSFENGVIIDCWPPPPSRGFPFPVVVSGYRGNELIGLQILGFLINFSIYFIVFGAIYFAYWKFFKKAKKK